MIELYMLLISQDENVCILIHVKETIYVYVYVSLSPITITHAFI